MKRGMRVAYLAFVACVTGFGVGVLGFSLVEATGGSEVSTGRVIERVEGERTVTICPRAGERGSGRCRTTTYPTFTVIGEREDGSTWLTVGEGPFDATRGELGTIEVRTANTTGRVIGLATDARSWSHPSGGYILGASAFLAFWAILVVAYEGKRRSGSWKMGSFQGAEPIAAVPGVIAGGGLALWLMLGPAWGLDVVTSQEAQGGFLADPFGYADVRLAADENDEPGVQLDDPFRAGGVDIVVVGQEHLAPDIRESWQSADGVLAIPVLRFGEPTGRFNTTWFRVFNNDTSFDPVRCPESLPDFPSRSSGDTFTGFVCFDAAASTGVFQVWVGTNLLQDLVAQPDYQLVDGTTVSADTE